MDHQSVIFNTEILLVREYEIVELNVVLFVECLVEIEYQIDVVG